MLYLVCKEYTDEQMTRKAGQQIEFEVPDSTKLSDPRMKAPEKLRGKWAGSATHDKLKSYWLSKRFPGNQLVQITFDVRQISETDKETGESIWAPAPEGTRLFFVLEAPPPGKEYRLAKLLTVKANEEQLAFFNQENDSVPFTGKVEGGQLVLVPLPPVGKRDKPQGELF